MDSSKIFDDVDCTLHSLMCSICCQKYGSSNTHPNVPWALLCGHSVCASCLIMLADMDEDGRYSKCPICREQFNLEDDVATNLTLIDIIAQKEKAEAAKNLERVRAPICGDCSQAAPRGVFLFCVTCDPQMDAKKKVCAFCSCLNHRSHHLISGEQRLAEMSKLTITSHRRKNETKHCGSVKKRDAVVGSPYFIGLKIEGHLRRVRF